MDERRAMKGPPAGPILRIAPLRYTRAVAMPPDSLPPDVVEALKLGKPIEAIKRLRKSTGVGLAEAKALVDAFSAGNTAYQRPGRKSRKRPDADVAAVPVATAAVDEDIIERREAPPPNDNLSGMTLKSIGLGEVQHSNTAFWLVIFLLIVALVGYVVLGK